MNMQAVAQRLIDMAAERERRGDSETEKDSRLAQYYMATVLTDVAKAIVDQYAAEI